MRGVLSAVLLAEPGGPGLSGAGGDAAARGRRRPVSGCDARGATRSQLPSAGPEPAGRRATVEADPGTEAHGSCVALPGAGMDAAAGRSGSKAFAIRPLLPYAGPEPVGWRVAIDGAGMDAAEGPSGSLDILQMWRGA